MKIEYPTEEQMDKAIDRICANALPKRESLFSFLYKLTSQVGFWNIIRGAWDVLVIAAAVFFAAGIISALNIASNVQHHERLTAIVFAVSPVLLMLSYVLSYIKERTQGLFAVKMTCKYTVHHILAYRMLVFSFFSIVLNTGYIVYLNWRFSVPMLSLLCVSFSSLFLFSLVLLWVVWKLPALWGVIVLSVVWCLCNAFPLVFCQAEYGRLLQSVPVAVWGLACILFLGVYWNRMSAYINRRLCYAHG